MLFFLHLEAYSRLSLSLTVSLLLCLSRLFLSLSLGHSPSSLFSHLSLSVALVSYSPPVTSLLTVSLNLVSHRLSLSLYLSPSHSFLSLTFCLPSLPLCLSLVTFLLSLLLSRRSLSETPSLSTSERWGLLKAWVAYCPCPSVIHTLFLYLLSPLVPFLFVLWCPLMLTSAQNERPFTFLVTNTFCPVQYQSWIECPGSYAFIITVIHYGSLICVSQRPQWYDMSVCIHGTDIWAVHNSV